MELIDNTDSAHIHAPNIFVHRERKRPTIPFHRKTETIELEGRALFDELDDNITVGLEVGVG